MKRIFMFSFFVLFLMQSSLGQNLVSNVNWQLDDTEERILITYDLEKDGSYRYLDVSVKVYIDNNELIPKALTGDVGTYIKAGNQKTIIWDVFKDVVELSGELTIEVIALSPKISTTESTTEAKNTPQVKINKVPVYAGLGGVVTIGAGLIVAGIGQESDSKELYDIYEQNLDPLDVIYNELTRQEHYDNANSKHKTGQWMTYGGIAVIVTGGIILIKRFIDIKKWEKMGNVSIEPEINYIPCSVADQPIQNTNIKLNISYRF